MANQNLAIALLITYLVALMPSTGQSSTQDCVRKVAEANLLAHDAISLSIEETKELKRFVYRLVKLKSLQSSSENASGLSYCHNGLTHDLSKLKSSLYKLKNLKKTATHVAISAPLKVSIDSAMVSVQACRVAIGDVDTAFADILTRKVNDLGFMVDDVEFRVSQLITANQDEAAINIP